MLSLLNKNELIANKNGEVVVRIETTMLSGVFFLIFFYFFMFYVLGINHICVRIYQLGFK